MAVAWLGFTELLVIVMGGGLFSSGAFGLPPGERVAALVRCPPADAILYVEWAARAGGREGAPGIDGLAADPEVRSFLTAVEKAILAAVERESQGAGREAQVLGRHIPPLGKRLLNRSGCLYVSFDEQAQPLEAPDEGLPGYALQLLSGARATLVVNGGDAADEIARHAEALVALLPERVRTRGLDHQPLPLPMPGATLVLHRHEDHFILGFGEGAIDAAVAGLSGKSQGLAANERFQAATKRLAIDRLASVSWFDVKALLEKAQVVLGPQGELVPMMARTLGLDTLDSVASVTGVEDGLVVTRSFVHTGGGTKGLLAFAAGRGLKPADFAHVPRDADLVSGLSLNPQQILAAVRQIVSEAHPPSGDRLEQLLMQLEAELGVSFEDDVFPAFGDVWTVYDSPDAGGVLFTSAVATLEVREPARARQVFDQLMTILDRALPGEFGDQFRRRGVFLEHKEFMGHEVYYINTVGDEVPFAPAFCVTDTHLLIAPHPQAVKAHLRFVGSRGASFSERATPPAEPAGDVLCYSYVDAPRAVQLFYATAPYWGQLVFSELQRDGASIDIFALPSARAILPYVSESSSRTVRQQDGILMESRRGLPLPGGAGVLLNMPLLFLAVPVGARVEAVPAIRVNMLPSRSGRIPVVAGRGGFRTQMLVSVIDGRRALAR
ncbi:MAG TPA: hypothetical protein VML55_11610 [Planctomycetaceae bacterium]|nr:hypothetical protein [Planctomycetaceae bacterium]